MLLKVDSSLWNYLGCQGKGEEEIEFVTEMVVNRLMCQLRLVKKILAILSCLDCLLKAWAYMVFREGNMHVCIRTAGLRHPAKTGWGKKCCRWKSFGLFADLICAFILCGCEYSQLSLGNKSTLPSSHGATKCIFRLLIYCNTPSSEKPKVSLRSILCSQLMKWWVLQSKKNLTSSAAALPHTQKLNLVFFTLLNVCCWQCWRSLFFQAMKQCGAAFVYFVPQPHFSNMFSHPFFLSPHFFCMRPLCTDTFSGAVFLYLADSCTTYNGHYVPYLHLATHLIGKTRNQADSGVQYLLIRVICSLSCSLPWHLSFSHSLQPGLMPSKGLLGPMT